MDYLLDTNILIEWFGHGPSQQFLEQQFARADNSFATSWICAAEFLVKAGTKETDALHDLIEAGDLLLYDLSGFDLLDLVSTARRELRLRLPDCIVLATARHYQCTLVTRDGTFAKRSKTFYPQIVHIAAT